MAQASADVAPTTGTPAFATDGNPSTGTPATQWPAYQYNAIQEELIAAINAGALTADRTKNNQLATVLNGKAALAGNAAQSFDVANAAVGSLSQAVNQGQFPSSLAANGYKKYPDPTSPTGYMIEQWGIGTTDASGKIYVTFPIPFPNAVNAITGNHLGTGGASLIVVYGSLSNNGVTLNIFNVAGATQSSWYGYWRAIGF